MLPLIDQYARTISYLRLSVTDRCDFRCVYCMPECMNFLPKSEVLSIEELDYLARVFIKRGVTKLRITGGEPLVRRDIMKLITSLGSLIGGGLRQESALQELTITTNGSQLAKYASGLYAAGVRRINVSLDSLCQDRFARITRSGNLARVLEGIEAAALAGLMIKINTVALKGVNDDELLDLMFWAHSKGFMISFIETMPMGEYSSEYGEGRIDNYLPLSEFRKDMDRKVSLITSDHRSSGPARYFTVLETGGQVGFITPLSNHFCADCNRVRLTCTGKLYLCLGQDSMVDLATPLRSGCGVDHLNEIIDGAIAIKPRGHDFAINNFGVSGVMSRSMSLTGG